MAPDDSLVARMDRLGVGRMARAAGLPEPLADRVAQVVVDSGLPEDRRAEVFRELVGHFEDGLAAGRTVEDLLAAFGDAGRAARLVAREKRIVTPEALGGRGRGDGILRRLGRDARYAIRRLAASPLFTATAVLSLAIGIGANSAMFTLVNEVIFRKPPVADPETLADLYIAQPDFPFNVFSYPDLVDLGRATTDVFEGVAGSKIVLIGRESGAGVERVMGEAVTPNFFQLLGLSARVGRMIAPADAPAPGTGSVVVLSDGYWRRAFGGDPTVVGRSIRLSGAAYSVIGIAPPDYRGTMPGIATDVYVPITMLRSLEPSRRDPVTDRSLHAVFSKARLKAGVSLEAARVAVDRVAADFASRRAGDWHPGDRITILPSSEVIAYPPVDRLVAPIAGFVMVVIGLVLVIACANLAGFLLARAVDRRKEIAVRLSLGATRGQLIRQLLTETVLLALAGGGLGVVGARLALEAVLAIELPLPVPITFALPIDWRVAGFSVAIAIAAGLVFGLGPALQSTRLDLAAVIRAESGTGGRGRNRLRSLLVGGQVAVAVLLLVTAGLFIRSLAAIDAVDPGFGAGPTGVLLLGIPANRDPAQTLATIEELERRTRAIPGMRAAGFTSNLHLAMHSVDISEIAVDGVEPPAGRTGFTVDRASIDTGFIAAVGLRLERGRNFTAADGAAGPPVVLVNREFARRFFPGADPVGREIRDATRGRLEIVGVVNTAKIRTIAEDPRPFVYYPAAQSPPDAIWLVGRADGATGALLPAMLQAVRQTDPDLLILGERTLARMLEVQTLPIRLGAGLLAAIAGLALVMASIGLYGTVSYAVAQRTREVGIRLSLGADRRSVIGLLLAGGVKLVVAGALAGLMVAALAASALQGLLFGVRALDPLVFAGVPVVLVLVAIVAAYLPARRAGRVDPVIALKTE